MIDREYVKLNSSIQTGSNSDQLQYDEEGNVKAVIELRLPENLFGSNTGPKKIENVAMQTSKFRLSMENTPIAQFPLATEPSKVKKVVDGVKTACQLDVYPYVFLNDKTMKPTPTLDNNTAFPYYKAHEVKYTIQLADPSGSTEPIILYSDYVQANTKGYGFPEDNIFYPILEGNGILESVERHSMNLYAQNNREMIETDEKSMFAKNIGTLEQMLQSAIENAITYASTNDHQEIVIQLADTRSITPDMQPKPNTDIVVTIPDRGIDVCLWSWYVDEEHSNTSSHLKFACKPAVKIGGDYLSISFDSSAFEAIVPIIFNSGYINTYEHPEQMLIDDLRKSAWGAPPPKRVYKYHVSTGEDSSYTFTLPTDINAMVMNLIANKALRDTFSFLPWITVDTKNYEAFKRGGKRFTVTKTKEVTTTITTNRYIQFRDINGTEFSGRYRRVTLPSHIYAAFSYLPDDDHHYIVYRYSWYPDLGDAQHQRFNQDVIVMNASNPREYLLPSPQVFESSRETKTVTSDPIITTEVYETNDPSLSPGSSSSSTSTTSSIDDVINNVSAAHVVSDTMFVYFKQMVDGVMTWVQADSHLVYIGVGTEPGQAGLWEYEEGHFKAFGRNLPTWESAGFHEEWDEDHTYKTRYVYWQYDYVDPEESDNNVITLWGNDNSFGSTQLLEEVIETPSIVTTTTVTETIVEHDTSLITEPKVLPNLDLDDGKFYVLDGTAADVTIGPQEVIQYDPSQEYLFKIYEEKVLTEYENTGFIQTHGISAAIPPVINKYNIENDVTVPTPQHTFTNIIAYYETFIMNIDNPDQPGTGRVIRRWMYWPKTLVSSTPDPSEYAVIASSSGPFVVKGTSTEYNTSYSNDESLEPGTETTSVDSDTVTRREAPSVGPTVKYNYTYSVIRHTSPYDVIQDCEATYAGEAYIDPSYRDYFATPIPNEGEALYTPPYMYKCEVVTSPETDYTGRWPENFWRRSVYWSIAPVDQTNPASFKYVSAPFVQTTTHDSYVNTKTTTTISNIPSTVTYDGNVRLTFTWPNLPMVVMSPIASIILTLDGVEITQEIQPYNIAQPTGSSLTATIPVVENFYSFAQTLRDLHDELVVVKDQFGETATYTLNNAVGRERVLRLTAKYLAKDGTVHQIYIPPKGVFSVQLTFGLSFFYSS